MRRVRRCLGLFGAASLASGLVAVLFLVVAMNTRPGRELFENFLSWSTSGEVLISGLAGRFPHDLHADRLELSDERGAWLLARDVNLVWSPLRLFHAEVRVDRLEAFELAWHRLPDYPPEADETSWDLPLPITLEIVRVAMLRLSPDLVGTAAELNVTGSARFANLDELALELALERRDRQGTYRLNARHEYALLHLSLSVEEPAEGLLANWSGLPELGTLSLEGSLDGPLSSTQVALALRAGVLRADLRGAIDFRNDAMTLTIAASASRMRLGSDWSWQAAAVEGMVEGPFTRPGAQGNLRVDDLRGPGSAVRHIAADLEGNADGSLQLRARLEGIRIPGSRPDLFEAAPLQMQVRAALQPPERPVDFTLEHPLLHAQGRLATGMPRKGDISLTLPDLRPYAASGGVDARGRLEVALHAAEEDRTIRLDSQSVLRVTGGDTWLLALFGNTATLAASGKIRDADVTLSRLDLKGERLTASVNGRYNPTSAELSWKAALSDLSAFSPELSGLLAAEGRLSGPPRDLNLTAAVSGRWATRGVSCGPIQVRIQLHKLPASPTGTMTGRVSLAEAPLDFAVNLAQPASREIRLVLERATWNTARARGAFVLPPAGPWPAGTLAVRVERLSDLQPLLGHAVTGTAEANVEIGRRNDRPRADLLLDAHDLSLPGLISIGSVSSRASIVDLDRSPKTEGRLTLKEGKAGTWSGSARLDFAGPLHALALDLSTDGQFGGKPAHLTAAGALDARRGGFSASTVRASWGGERVQMLTPTRVNFADGMSLDRLRLGIRQGEIDIAGRLSPVLDLRAGLRDIPLDLAALAAPEFAAEGFLNAEAELKGSHAQPRGSLYMTISGFRLRRSPWHALPPARVAVRADSGGAGVQVDARLDAGPQASLSLNGRVPMSTGGSLDLRQQGTLDLKMLDPLLTPQGRRVQGRVTTTTRVSGTLAEPGIEGELRLAKGDLQDFALGAHLADGTALMLFDRSTIRISRFDGRMGNGKLTASGTLGWRQPGLPIELKLLARNASVLSGERLSVTLNSDLALRGGLRDKLTLAGLVGLRRAEIRIPEHLPARIAVLAVRRPGESPPLPPAPGPDFGLDLTIDAPGEIFVRGRGVDAELSGKVRLRGTARNPEPAGRFVMRRGDLKLAGRTLAFSKGEVGFDGGTLTDPALDFVASTASANVTATLTVGGTAAKPKIALSSVPDLPRDEILSQLLFSRAASSLGPVELAQTAAALASLTGVTGKLGSPLDKVRQGLGLDRLTLGSGKTGPTLEAGRYLAPGVYLGAKQGFTGSAPQAAVQIDLTEGLKVEGTVGTGSPATNQSGTSSVGVIYQFEY